MTAASHSARQLAPDLWLLDTLFQGEPGVIASYLLTGPDGLALVDVGSGATLPQLLAAIRATGHAPEEIAHILITHVHLDHAGAAGALLAHTPHAKVYVHHIGAPHLVNPDKLLVSAQRIYGDQMERLWGEILPVPAERMVTLDDETEVRVGQRTLHALYTPGHAIHHVVYYDPAHAAVFTGDVAGVRLEDIPFVRPPTPPPDLNLEDWAASIARIQALRPETLYLPHFGPAPATENHFTQLRERLDAWGALVARGMREGKDDQAIARDLAVASDPEVAEAAAMVGPLGADAVARYELATNYLMSAQGYMRYYRKVHPEALA